MIGRRTFISQSAKLGLATVMGPGLFDGPVKKKYEWGIILNTVRQAINLDYQGTLRKLAKMGYQCIEGGVQGESAEQYSKLLKELGLKSIASGSSMDPLTKDLSKYIDICHSLNQEYLVCYWPWMSSANNLTHDECLETAERINLIGEKVFKEGLTFAWHNHDKEFVDINGKLAFDILMEQTDPRFSTVQLDWYWVVKGNQDPVDLFKKYPGRFELAHVKDMDNSDLREKACVGEGILDFSRIFKYARLGGLRYPIVEQESVVEGMRCAEVSIDHLQELKN